MSLSALVSTRIAWTVVTGALQVEAGADGVVELAWNGCRAELRGPRCVTEQGAQLVLWTRLPGATASGEAKCGKDTALAITGHGHTIQDTGPADGGCWTRLRVDDPSGLLELRGPDKRPLWSLPFVPTPAQDSVVTEAGKQFTAGHDAAANRLLQSALARLGAQGASLELARALDLDRKIAFRNGEFVRGLASAEAALDLYESLGWTSSACDITYALMHHHWVEQHHADALAALNRGARCAAQIPRYAVNHRYNHATLVEDLGDAYDTWVAYRDIDVLARRLRDLDFEAPILAAQHVLAEQLRQHQDIRRIEQRLQTLQAQLSTTDSCGLINALSNVSWSRLMRRERGESDQDASEWLERVVQRYSKGACRDADDLRNATINLALGRLQNDEPVAATRLLMRLPATPDDPESELWRHIILARAGLTRRNFKQASVHSAALDELAARHADPYFGWYAAFTRGELLAAQDLPTRAIAAYEEAEALRDEIALPLALGAGRERAIAPWELSAHRLIALWLAQGQPATAMQVARLARRRTLQALEGLAALDAHSRDALADEVRRRRDAIDIDAEGDDLRTGDELAPVRAERRRQRMDLRRLLDWAASGPTDPATELRKPSAGELLLVYQRLENGWVGFADDGTHVTSTFIASAARELSGTALGSALFDPFADAIAAARNIRIVADGALLAHDLHALPHRGRPLFTHSPVVYSLDLPEPRLAPRPYTRGLVVAADPGGEEARLNFVEEEASSVVKRLETLGIVTTRQVGLDAVRSALLRELPGADILHFAGHHARRADASGSRNAWDHELLLARGTTLAVEDVLVAGSSSMPRFVFLSACETGMTDPAAASGGVAIGHSFLLRGAELVLATARPVDDAVVTRFAETYYRMATDVAALTDPATLAATQRELLGDATCNEHPDVCAYRAWVP